MSNIEIISKIDHLLEQLATLVSDISVKQATVDERDELSWCFMKLTELTTDCEDTLGDIDKSLDEREEKEDEEEENDDE